MDHFLNSYEKNVKELKKQGIIPEVVLAMQLINSTGLDKAVDYIKKEEMYEQMKNALRKFFGN